MMNTDNCYMADDDNEDTSANTSSTSLYCKIPVKQCCTCKIEATPNQNVPESELSRIRTVPKQNCPEAKMFVSELSRIRTVRIRTAPNQNCTL
uniref:Uncharacterized protein n=1 Tax=Caenorhabditis japonica TaxID=281687 RepID=A0A8R1IJ47_CAEJA